tara:strand:+ start:1258 stop:1461 length:204 start_codon:yes stop_codon:yes gene_type:complete
LSNRQLEDLLEQKRDRAIAKELGISLKELEQRGYSLDENVGNDGTVYSYIVTFDDGTFEHIELPLED